jgi:flagellar basal-body rod modification protein FlgD
MAAAAGIFAHTATAAQALAGKTIAPADSTPGSSSTSGSSSSSTSDSATISANDFLSLLVTEMQNQDPTADTDPNEYVNQLVQVNSLEQLININQTLTGALGTTDPSTDATTSSGSSSDSSSGSSSSSSAALHPSATAQTHTTAHPSAAAGTVASAAMHAPGNLSIPADHSAAESVGHSLNGHPRIKPTTGRFPQAI